MLIDPRCKVLIKALSSGWRYEKTKSGNEKDTPEKNASSHPGDALTYLAQYMQGGAAKAARRAANTIPLQRSVNPYNMR